MGPRFVIDVITIDISRIHKHENGLQSNSDFLFWMLIWWMRFQEKKKTNKKRKKKKKKKGNGKVIEYLGGVDDIVQRGGVERLVPSAVKHDFVAIKIKKRTSGAMGYAASQQRSQPNRSRH